MSICVYDMLGRKLFDINALRDNKLDLRSLTPGTYNLLIKYENAKPEQLRLRKQ